MDTFIFCLMTFALGWAFGYDMNGKHTHPRIMLLQKRLSEELQKSAILAADLQEYELDELDGKIVRREEEPRSAR